MRLQPPIILALLPERMSHLDKILMTQEGFDKLQQELNELRTTGRAEVSEKIRVARGFGDLSENSEYDEAKNDQAVMEARIAQLEEQLKHVEIIEAEDIATDMVSVGSVVKILDIEYGAVMTFRVVSSLESGGEGETITDTSPVGQALLGHRVGEVVDVEAPAGVVSFKILEIGR